MTLNKKLLILICAGIFIRLSLLFIDFSWDIHNHIVWAKDLWQRGFTGFYETPSSEVYASLYPNYPPFALFIFYIIYPLQSIFFKLAWYLNTTLPIFPSKLIFFIESRAFLAGLFKIPGIIADMGIVVLCYKIVRALAPKNKKLSLVVVSAVLLNPAYFYNSAFWGQIDAIPLFFALFSIYLLIFEKKSFASSLSMILGLLIKPTIIVFLPVYFAYFITRYSRMDFARAILAGVAIFTLTFAPFFGGAITIFDPFVVYYQKILTTQSLPYVTNGAFNFWVLITYFEGIKDTAMFLFGVSYRQTGYMITGVICLFVIYFFLNANKSRLIYFALFLTSTASFLFLTKMHERYSLLPLVFLLLASVIQKDLWKWFCFFSVVSFLNLYHSWPVPNNVVLQTVINNKMFVEIISVLNVVIFFLLLKKYYLSCVSSADPRLSK